MKKTITIRLEEEIIKRVERDLKEFQKKYRIKPFKNDFYENAIEAWLEIFEEKHEL